MVRAHHPGLFVLAALLFAACDGQSCGPFVGSGHEGSVARNVQPFRTVSVHDGIVVQLAMPPAGQPNSVEVRTDDNLLDLISTRNEGDRLVIEWVPNVVLTSDHGPLVIVTNHRLEGVEATGGAKVSGSATETGDYLLTASGGAEINISGIQSGRVLIDVSGGGQVTAAGLTNDVSVISSGGSQANTDGVNARNVYVGASGGSILTVRANEQANGSLSGASRVTVNGHPAVKQITATGGSTVTYPE